MVCLLVDLGRLFSSHPSPKNRIERIHKEAYVLTAKTWKYRNRHPLRANLKLTVDGPKLGARGGDLLPYQLARSHAHHSTLVS
jgi:hypothetical protein